MEWRQNSVLTNIRERINEQLTNTSYHLYLNLADPFALYIILIRDIVSNCLEREINIYLSPQHYEYLREIGIQQEKIHKINNNTIINQAFCQQISHEPLQKGKLFQISDIRQQHLYLALISGSITIDEFIASIFAVHSPMTINKLSEKLKAYNFEGIALEKPKNIKGFLIIQDTQKRVLSSKDEYSDMYLYELIREASFVKAKESGEDTNDPLNYIAATIANAIIFKRIFKKKIRTSKEFILSELRLIGRVSPRLVTDIATRYLES